MIKIKFEVDKIRVLPDVYWKKLPEFPFAISSHTTSSVDNDVYVIFGRTDATTLSNTIYKLTDNGTIWEEIIPVSTTNPVPRYLHSACVVGKKIYVFGGSADASTRLNDCWEFNTETNTWTKKSDLPAYLRSMGCVVRNGNIVAIGGYGGASSTTQSRVSSAYEYLPHEDKWYKAFDMPSIMSDASACYDKVTKKIYLYGGFRASSSNRLYEIDVENNVTYSIEHEPARYSNSNFLRDSELYTLFGTPNSPCEKYNFETDTWTFIENAPTSRYEAEGTNIKDGIVYVGGILSANSERTKDVWKLVLPVEPINPIEEPFWEKMPNLPANMYGHSMVHFENKLYVFGGVANGALSNKLYQFDLESGTDWEEITGTGTSYTAVQGHCATVSPDGWMYIAGGITGLNVSSSVGTLNAFKRFNLRTRVWEALPNLSTTTRVSKMVYWNNFIIFSRGLSSSTQVVLPNTFNTLDKTFHTPSSGNITREYFSGMCNANGQIHNHGGTRTGSTPFDSVKTWRYTKGGNWVVDSDVDPSSYANDLEPLNDYFFSLNGLSRNVNAAAFITKPNSRFFVFDPDTKTRTTILPPVNHKNIYQFASASRNNEMFQSGGQYNDNFNDPSGTASFSPNGAVNGTTSDVWKLTIPGINDNKEGTWEKLPDYPNTYGSNPIILKSVIVGDFLYTFTSTSTTSTNTVVHKFNILTNQWISIGSFNNKLDSGNSSCTVHGKIIYFFGTNISAAPTNQVSRFDTETDSFLSVFSSPVTAAYGTAGVTIGDEIWFIGGYGSGAPTNIARIHNPVTNTWREEAMASSPNTWFGSAVDFNGQPCIGFGDSSVVGNKSRMYVRNDQGMWDVKGLIPNQLPKVFGRLNKIGKFIYISGFGNTNISNFTRFDTERSTWVTMEAPFTPHQFLSTTDDGNSIFILCGRNESSNTTPVRDVWKFTPKYK